jgi:putative DNA methylase
VLDYDKSFIEVQFPVSKLSMESYKERKANLGQTLTGLGKWWGRKPLILARAAILGLLMPVSKDPIKDREVFLKILSMDDEGLWQRKQKSISTQEIYDNLTKNEQQRYFEKDTKGKLKYKKSVTKEERLNLQKLIFNRFSYDQKLTYCIRPEELENISQNQWVIVNEHLGTKAANIKELVQQLGEKKFGKTPIIGDCFAGGGSVPFEAARLGCDVYASDLNPVAMLLTWAALNINGASDEEIEKLKEFQEKIFNLADKQITEWGIEHNEQGHRANSYLYCHETICPECGYKVPLAPSWIIGKGTKTVALLKENKKMGFDIDIVSNASNEQIKKAESLATIENSNLKCPHCNMTTPITTIRKDRKVNGGVKYGLRKWGEKEFTPRENDVFQERLYCVRYVQEYLDDRGNVKTKRYYQAPTKEDLVREEKVIELLYEKFDEWQGKGYIPSTEIEDGHKTKDPKREKGWAYWHQLFNPRQLLVHGLLMELVDGYAEAKDQKIIGLLGINKCCDWNSKLGVWHSGAGVENSQNTFLNQALNCCS